MIYFHNENGDVITEYSSASGIEYILEYNCRGEHRDMKIDTTKKRFVHFACQDKYHLEEIVKMHEVLLYTSTKSYLGFKEPDWCVRTYEGFFSYFIRSVVKIKWNRDYHFYPNKEHTDTIRPS